MNEYERMSRQAVEFQKNMTTGRTDNNNNDEQPEEPKNKTFAGVMGIVFIILGVVGFIGIMLSFDWELYNEVKDYTSYEIEANIMKSELTTTVIMAGATLIINLAVGSILIALDTIINLLKSGKEIEGADKAN